MQVLLQKWANFLIQHAQQMSVIVMLNRFSTHMKVYGIISDDRSSSNIA